MALLCFVSILQSFLLSVKVSSDSSPRRKSATTQSSVLSTTQLAPPPTFNSRTVAKRAFVSSCTLQRSQRRFVFLRNSKPTAAPNLFITEIKFPSVSTTLTSSFASPSAKTANLNSSPPPSQPFSTSSALIVARPSNTAPWPTTSRPAVPSPSTIASTTY